MGEVAVFVAAGGAFGIVSALVNGRRSTALAMLAWLYIVALAVAVLVGTAAQVEVMAFLAPYVLALAVGSMAGAAAIIRWPVRQPAEVAAAA